MSTTTTTRKATAKPAAKKAAPAKAPAKTTEEPIRGSKEFALALDTLRGNLAVVTWLGYRPASAKVGKQFAGKAPKNATAVPAADAPVLDALAAAAAALRADLDALDAAIKAQR